MGIDIKNFNVLVVSDAVFSYVSDAVTPQGVLAVLNEEEKIPMRPNAPSVLLDGVSDPGNMGTIIRTCAAVGVKDIFLVDCCDPYSPKAQRSAMGSLLRLPVIVADNFSEQMIELKAKGMTLFATTITDADINLGTFKFPSGSVVMIGNEGKGLSGEAISLADKKVTIVMSGRNESLNASVAASLFMWEMTKGEN